MGSLKSQDEELAGEVDSNPVAEPLSGLVRLQPNRNLCPKTPTYIYIQPITRRQASQRREKTAEVRQRGPEEEERGVQQGVSKIKLKIRMGNRERVKLTKERLGGWSERLGFAGDEGGARLRRAPICEGGPRVATRLG